MEQHGHVAKLLLDGAGCPDDVVLVRHVTLEPVGNVSTVVDPLHQDVIVRGVDVDAGHFGAKFGQLNRQIPAHAATRSEDLQINQSIKRIAFKAPAILTATISPATDFRFGGFTNWYNDLSICSAKYTRMMQKSQNRIKLEYSLRIILTGLR